MEARETQLLCNMAPWALETESCFSNPGSTLTGWEMLGKEHSLALNLFPTL